MRTMTPTERSYVAGIIDGEGSIEYTQRDRIRHDRPGKPVHKVWNIRMEVPQVDGRLIDYLMTTTDEGVRVLISLVLFLIPVDEPSYHIDDPL